MAFEIQSLIKKRIDETGSLTFFFEVTKRPKGALLFELEFSSEKKGTEPFLAKLELPSLKKHSSKTPSGYGYFNVIAPDGFLWDKIRIRSKVALFKPWSGWDQVALPSKFEDVFLAEQEYEKSKSNQK